MPRIAIACLLALTSLCCRAELPLPVLQALRAVDLPSSSVSAVVQEVGAMAPSVRHRADVAVNPASVMKLVTTYAALELLGPAYRWKTEAFLDGDTLILRGTGDPKLTYESFWLLLRALRSRGLREIRGDVLLDRTFFGAVAAAPLDDETFRPYNVVPDALLVNFKSLHFTFLPEGAGVRLFVDPGLPGLEILNTLKVVDGPCPEGRAFRDLVRAEFHSRPPRASFTGAYPALCGEKDMNVALHAPEDYLEGMIRHLWTELGGSWQGGDGKAGIVREGIVPAGARLLYTHESEPLAEVVRDINKFSNNVMARQLYLTLAAETGGAPAQPEKALAAIRQWLARKNVPAPELVMENGSGLSRSERISAAGLAAILRAAWHSPVMPELISSLPVVAADGTMRKRLRGEPVAGQAHIKTGLLNDVRSVAGYVLDRNGTRQIVVMIVNHPRAPEAQAALDALVSWAYAQPPPDATGRARSTSRPRASSPRRP
jgi:D-alanyl-D-alanine carboxypeptidase/D-alanyl-D-alanine-endopeptidase (penicillin-binding protein 4)